MFEHFIVVDNQDNQVKLSGSKTQLTKQDISMSCI